MLAIIALVIGLLLGATITVSVIALIIGGAYNCREPECNWSIICSDKYGMDLCIARHDVFVHSLVIPSSEV